jgi:serine protease Do
VVENADEILVTLHDNRSYTAAVIGTDPTTDLALVKIDETGLTSIPMVNSDEIEVGEWVLAMGNPFNLNSTVTAGIVSAKSRNINILSAEYAIEAFIQTDAAINPGNSGGALVNMQGGLVGINTAIASPTGCLFRIWLCCSFQPG